MVARAGNGKGLITRNVIGSSLAESFMIIAIATILLTRLYLEITGYPQVGGGTLHIAHALYGGAMMMLALLIGWLALGFGARILSVVLGGIGFGLFLDEVGKFVTKDNDYFFGPSAEIMYVLVLVVLVGSRILRTVRPPSAREYLASAMGIAADGVARGLAPHRRRIALLLLDRAAETGADDAAVEHIRALIVAATPTSARLYALQQFVPRLIPDFFRSPRWIPVVGWTMVIVSFLSVVGAVSAIAFGDYYNDDDVDVHFEGWSISTFILMVSAILTFALACPAMFARKRTDRDWPLRWLRAAALIFTLLNALVDFAAEGFGALSSMAIGLFTLAIVSYQLDVLSRREVPANAIAAAG
ncbi:hypothetical protein OG921_11795 [Aldersonia sp. NBC_00410]|uniref:hypothetical protein n=1 Tax=Aldersonia sp. NBC_00410 TaxID=2975954 RepID=UPI00225A7BFC|nr:hypothetical protein [Aldersonia sp. NBC_00410]MCX5043848.1 hypothetical protein [Aldersonia sp. NBC_00410]